MVSVPGIFKDGKITLLEPILNIKQARVIVTVLDNLVVAGDSKDANPDQPSWLGCMAGTAEIVGDIVSPMEETWNDWEVLRA